jgi:uncharacterized membrane protein
LLDQTKVLYGPMQIFVIAFLGNQFKSEIVPAIAKARDQGIIRLIDYIFVVKDQEGNIEGAEGTDLGRKEVKELHSILDALLGFGLAGLEGGAKVRAEVGSKFGEYDIGLTTEDIKNIVNKIPNNSSALLIVVEHLWAKEIKQAVIDADGIVVAQGMLTPGLVIMMDAALKG